MNETKHVVVTKAFEIFIISGLFFLLMLSMVAGIMFCRYMILKYTSSFNQLHAEHRNERSEWARENQRSVDNVGLVLTELTAVIRTANERATVQINNNGSTGTQDQKGNNNNGAQLSSN